jgi:hypothetical protein
MNSLIGRPPGRRDKGLDSGRAPLLEQPAEEALETPEAVGDGSRLVALELVVMKLSTCSRVIAATRPGILADPRNRRTGWTASR